MEKQMFGQFLEVFSKPHLHGFCLPSYDLSIEYQQEDASLQVWKAFHKDGTLNKTPVPPETEWQRIGCSGWNRVDNQAEFILFDLDTDHGKNLPQEQVDNLVRELSGKIDICRSTGGKGYHGRLYIDPIPCHSQAEYQKIGENIRDQMSREWGITINSDNPPFLWIAARDSKPESFELVSNSSPTYKVTYQPEPEPERRIQTASILEAVRHLDRIPADDYQLWIKVGAALWNEFPEVGLQLWEDWSRSSKKYREGDCEAKWNTFHPHDNPATLGTIRYLGSEKRYNVLDVSEFRKANFSREFLIDDFLVKNMQVVFGGGMKTYKTITMMETGVSLATRTKVYNRYQARKSVVGFMTGESGSWKLQETLIAQEKAKGIECEPGSYWITEDLPRFLVDGDIATLEKLCLDRGTEVLMIDPLYLCLGGADGTAIYSMAEPLRAIGDMCRVNNITLMLAHHSTKGSIKPGEIMELHHLTGAGIGEWLRQAVLISHRLPYVDGSWHADLWMRIVSGFVSATYAVSIDEDPWKAEVTPRSEIVSNEKELRQVREREELTRHIVPALQDGPLTITQLRERPHCRSVNSVLLEDLTTLGIVEPTTIASTDSRGRARTNKGFQLKGI